MTPGLIFCCLTLSPDDAADQALSQYRLSSCSHILIQNCNLQFFLDIAIASLYGRIIFSKHPKKWIVKRRIFELKLKKLFVTLSATATLLASFAPASFANESVKEKFIAVKTPTAFSSEGLPIILPGGLTDTEKLLQIKSINLKERELKQTPEGRTLLESAKQKSQNAGRVSTLGIDPVFTYTTTEIRVESSYDYELDNIVTNLNNSTSQTQSIQYTKTSTITWTGAVNIDLGQLKGQLGYSDTQTSTFSQTTQVPAFTTYYVHQVDHWRHIQGRKVIVAHELHLDGTWTTRDISDVPMRAEVPLYIGWKVSQ